jgi:hypothetical protein
MLRARFVFPVLAVAALVLVLTLPAVASAADFTFSVNTTNGTGEGEVECTIKVPGEEEEWEGEICDGTYPANTKITVLPSWFGEVEGSEFVGFANGIGSATGCTNKKTCSFKLTTNSSVDAVFDLEKFTLTIEKLGTGKGAVECSTGGAFGACAAKYPYETELILLAGAGSESDFIGWSEACEGYAEEEECELRIEENTAVTAIFNLQPRLKIEKLGSGAVASTVECDEGAGPEACRPYYPRGTELILVAEPEAESEFAGWSGIGIAECETKAATEEARCEFTLEKDTTARATFTTKATLTVEGIGPGKVTSSPGSIDCGSVCSGTFLVGSNVILTAAPSMGAAFVGWAGGDCQGIGPCTVTIPKGGIKIAATFKANPPATCATDSALCPVPGIAEAARSARVRGGKAALALTCSSGACKGSLKLTARVKHGNKKKNLVIGRASFSLAEGTSMVLKTKLSIDAKQALKGGKSLKAQVWGSGIKSGLVKLKS